MNDKFERVPYFSFVEREAGEDAEATARLGYAVPRLVTHILITPHGHKGDPIEFFADEFIARKDREAREGRYSHEWVKDFRAGLTAFREGKVLPRSGTPTATWERILKSRRETLAMSFPTVEDLAAVPDSSLSNIGLDGRVIRDLARAEIQAKTDLSPVVKELADAKETIRRMEEREEKMLARLELLESKEPKRKTKEVVEA